jgi:hypothetical protein
MSKSKPWPMLRLYPLEDNSLTRKTKQNWLSNFTNDRLCFGHCVLMSRNYKYDAR